MPNPIALTRQLHRSIALLRLCLAVLGADRRLLGLAVGNATIALVLGLAVILPALDRRADLSGPETYGVLGLIAALRVGSTLANAVLATLAIARLRGDPMPLAQAVGVVQTRLATLAVLSLLSIVVDTVTLLVRKWELPSILSPLAVVQEAIAGIIDTAWQLATFVALPVIVLEGRGPVASLRRSRDLIHGRWGLGVAAVVGLRAVGIALVAGIVLLASIATTAVPALANASMVVGLVAAGAVAVLLSAIGQVYRAAVYLHAAEGLAPEGFEEQLRVAFA
jgi:hypothetical protein